MGRKWLVRGCSHGTLDPPAARWHDRGGRGRQPSCDDPHIHIDVRPDRRNGPFRTHQVPVRRGQPQLAWSVDRTDPHPCSGIRRLHEDAGAEDRPAHLGIHLPDGPVAPPSPELSAATDSTGCPVSTGAVARVRVADGSLRVPIIPPTAPPTIPHRKGHRLPGNSSGPRWALNDPPPSALAVRPLNVVVTRTARRMASSPYTTPASAATPTACSRADASLLRAAILPPITTARSGTRR